MMEEAELELSPREAVVEDWNSEAREVSKSVWEVEGERGVGGEFCGTRERRESGRGGERGREEGRRREKLTPSLVKSLERKTRSPTASRRSIERTIRWSEDEGRRKGGD